jgi:hypothetical protein
MKIIEELEKQDNANDTNEYRLLKAVKVGKYKLSIQGSAGHYCSPRHSLPVNSYSEMEMAIINKNHQMISVNRSKLFKKFKRYNELLERADSLNSSCCVYGYVPIDLINDLYLFLLSNK